MGGAPGPGPSPGPWGCGGQGRSASCVKHKHFKLNLTKVSSQALYGNTSWQTLLHYIIINLLLSLLPAAVGVVCLQQPGVGGPVSPPLGLLLLVEGVVRVHVGVSRDSGEGGAREGEQKEEGSK